MKAKLRKQQTIFSLSILVESQGPGGIPFVLLHAHTAREVHKPLSGTAQKEGDTKICSQGLWKLLTWMGKHLGNLTVEEKEKKYHI